MVLSYVAIVAQWIVASKTSFNTRLPSGLLFFQMYCVVFAGNTVVCLWFCYGFLLVIFPITKNVIHYTLKGRVLYSPNIRVFMDSDYQCKGFLKVHLHPAARKKSKPPQLSQSSPLEIHVGILFHLAHDRKQSPQATVQSMFLLRMLLPNGFYYDYLACRILFLKEKMFTGPLLLCIESFVP